MYEFLKDQIGLEATAVDEDRAWVIYGLSKEENERIFNKKFSDPERLAYLNGILFGLDIAYKIIKENEQ